MYRGIYGCCCNNSTGYVTTRRYDASGNLLWNADFGIDTNDMAIDATDNSHVIGPRVQDITATMFQTGSASQSAIQQIAGAPATGGQFRMGFNGYRTSLLDWNCTAAQMQTALEALGNIGTGNILVSGAALNQFSSLYCHFQGSLANQAVSLFSMETYKLAGLPTVKTFNPSGSEILQGYTESTPNRIRYCNGYLYVACNRSAGLQLLQTTSNLVFRLSAYGDLTGGSFRIYRSSSPLRLEATGDLAYNCSASDVQTALRAFTAYGTAVSCTGGPLPFVPITITFTTDPTNNFNGAQLDIEQGNLTGGLNFYKLDPSNLSQQWAIDGGFSFANAVATDSGGKIYLGGRGAFGGTVGGETTARGENKTDSIQDDSDVYVRRYDNTGTAQTLAIKNHAGNPKPCVVDTSGNVFTNSDPWHKVYKLYLTGTVTGGTFQMAVGGSVVNDSFGHPVNFPYNVWNSKPGLPFGTGVADYLNTAGLPVNCIGDRNLSVSPIWIYFPVLANQTIYGALTIFSSSLTGGGSVHCDVVNVGDNSIITEAITKYDSTGARIAKATFISSNIGDAQPSGKASALDSTQRLCVSTWDWDNSSVLTLLSNDIGTLVWRAVLSGSLTGNSLPQTYACAFDSSNNVYQGGTRGSPAKSTRKFDNSTPPNLLWDRDHGLGASATLLNGQDPCVTGLGVTSNDELITTGVRVKL